MNDSTATHDPRNFELEFQASRIASLCAAAQCVLADTSMSDHWERENIAQHLMDCAAQLARKIALGEFHD